MLALTIGLAGCGFGTVAVPLALGNRDQLGFKMLIPNAYRRACNFFMWTGSEGTSELAGQAMRELLQADAEADVLRDAHVSWRGLDVGVFRAGCVSVRADIGRIVSTVSLPMLGDHGVHGSESDAE